MNQKQTLAAVEAMLFACGDPIASDKLAQQVGSQAIINTMLNGILIGNMGLATTLSMISMVPSIFFAAFGA